MEASNNILTLLIWSVNYRAESEKARLWGMQLLDMTNSISFAGLPILISESNPENFKPISQRI